MRLGGSMTHQFYPPESIHSFRQDEMAKLDHILKELQQSTVFYLFVVDQDELKTEPVNSTTLVLRHKDGIVFDLAFLWDTARLNPFVSTLNFTDLHDLLTCEFKEQYQGIMTNKGEIVDSF